MTTEDRAVGFVYVLTNDSMPGLVKIGLTRSLAEDRALSLYTTGVPAPFEIAFRSATSHPREVERYTHDLLDTVRYNRSREFFRIDSTSAVCAVRQALLEAGGIASWQQQPLHVIRQNDRLALTLAKSQIFALISYPDMMHMLAGTPKVLDLWQAHSNGDLLELMGTSSATHVSGFSDGDSGSTEDPVPYLDRGQMVDNGIMNGRERLVTGDRLVWLPGPKASGVHERVVFEADCDCQVVSRTWTPVSGELGLPLLLNDFLHKDIWPAAGIAIREALTLPAPRSWAPRSQRDGWVPIGTEPRNAEHWLSQLAPKRQKR